MLVNAKLLAQMLFGLHRTGKNHQAARLAVQTMHRTDVTRSVLAAAMFAFGDRARKQLIERRLELALAGRKLAFVGVPRRRHARRLFDDCNVLVEIANANVVFARRRGQRMRKHLDDVHQPKTLAGVRAEIAVDRHLSRLQQPADLGPRPAGQPLAQRGGNRLIDLTG